MMGSISIQQTLAIATVCFWLDVIPKASANFKIEWNVVLTGYHQPKQSKPDLQTIWWRWCLVCFMHTTHLLSWSTQFPDSLWYLIFRHAGPCCDPAITFCWRHPTPESLILPYRYGGRGEAKEVPARHLLTGKLMTLWGLISILWGSYWLVDLHFLMCSSLSHLHSGNHITHEILAILVH